MPDAPISPLLILALYCLVELFASLAGGWMILLVHLTHRRLQIGISFVAGLMLGVALLDFLPDGAEQLHSVQRTAAWTLGGFLTMFFVQRFFHFHHHDVPQGDPQACGHEAGNEDHDHEHGHEHVHDHDHNHGHEHAHEDEHAETHPGHTLAERSARQLSWIGTALGLTLHSLLDGLAMAAAVMAQTGAKVPGLSVALVVILHKPFDAMAVSTLMAAGGKSKSSRHWLNGVFALATPAGAFLFWLGAANLSHLNVPIVGCALAFCAGTFLCIAGSDLLPELQFHSHDRFKLSFALLAGVAVAIGISQFESADHPPTAASPDISRRP